MPVLESPIIEREGLAAVPEAITPDVAVTIAPEILELNTPVAKFAVVPVVVVPVKEVNVPVVKLAVVPCVVVPVREVKLPVV